jgi:hypothetical protein
MHQVKKLYLYIIVNIRVLSLQHSVVLFFIMMSGFGCTPKSQPDCGFVQNVYGQRISWKEKLPVEVVIDKSVPNELKPSIYRAAKTWEKMAGRELFVFIESKKNTGPSKDKKNGIYFLLNWDSNNRAEQGRTSVYWAGDEIQEADIRINGSAFAFYDRNPKNLVYLKNRFDSELQSAGQSDYLRKTESGRSESGNDHKEYSSVSQDTPELGYNFEALILHELGHFLGLKHKDLPASVMETYLAANTNRISLSDVDKKNIKCEYKE